MNTRYLWISLVCVLGIFVLADFAAAADAGAGGIVYDAKCKGCHGEDGAGGPLPNTSLLPAVQKSDSELKNIIRNGIPNTSMPPFTVSTLNDTDLDNVIAYIKASVHPPTPTETATETVTPTATPVTTTSTPEATTSKTPGFEIAFSAFGILLIYLLKRKN